MEVTLADTFLSETVRVLRQKYSLLPTISLADRSERLSMLEALCDALCKENELLTRLSSAKGSHAVPPTVIAWATKGSLFSHVDVVRAEIASRCPHVQWKEIEFQDQIASTTPRVLFFRVGQRVSASDVEGIRGFCTGVHAPLYRLAHSRYTPLQTRPIHCGMQVNETWSSSGRTS